MIASTPKARRGFTLIELLIVIAIIAILVGMLLPAIQKIRESANRAKCQNNLHNLGVAIRNYENQLQVLPELFINSGAKRSLYPVLLPFIDQEPLHRQYDFNSDCDGPGNRLAAQTRIDTLICPSVPHPDRRFAANSHPAATPADYMGIEIYDGSSSTATRQPTFYQVQSLPMPGDPWSGAMVRNKSSRLAEITDGPDNTILLAESAGRPYYWANGKMTDPVGMAGGANWIEEDTFIWMGVKNPAGRAINYTNHFEILSFHSGGAIFVLVSGATRSMKASISPATVGALATRAGGDVAGNDW
jgi:prepilin-type N-terminal cleavage/methylation domain-containing protein